MNQSQLLLSLAVLVTALLCAAVVRPVLSWLPEPTEPPADGPKVTYLSLASSSFVLRCALAAAVASAVAWTTLPPAVQPLWSVLSVGGVLLAAIDAATTWLPLPLVHVCWAAMTVAALIGASLAGSWSMLLRAGLGASLAGGMYLLVWVLTRGGVGYGDVRFAPLLGAAAAADSSQLLLWTLLAGSLLGGVHGLGRLVSRRRGSFPYAPAMLGGAYLAALVQALAR
ncbi:prepilin peptidase [uncultured Friedmanniella sp.]|uniref:prepilin peptidase n=1 Tax=uncultured Friedmanniella sp. TaxID=335381 RepID=UPI0035C9EDC5